MKKGQLIILMSWPFAYKSGNEFLSFKTINNLGFVVIQDLHQLQSAVLGTTNTWELTVFSNQEFHLKISQI